MRPLGIGKGQFCALRERSCRRGEKTLRDRGSTSAECNATPPRRECVTALAAHQNRARAASEIRPNGLTSVAPTPENRSWSFAPRAKNRFVADPVSAPHPISPLRARQFPIIALLRHRRLHLPGLATGPSGSGRVHFSRSALRSALPWDPAARAQRARWHGATLILSIRCRFPSASLKIAQCRPFRSIRATGNA
jgi:hypothetical protein